MRLFKYIGCADDNDVRKYIKDIRIIRLANSIVIEKDTEYLLVKLNGEKVEKINYEEMYDNLCNMKFITIDSHKHLSSRNKLKLYDKNVIINVEREIANNNKRLHGFYLKTQNK